MRYIDELKTTTNNYVFNRVRIPYISSCGWCGCGRSHKCLSSNSRKLYSIRKKYLIKYCKELNYYICKEEYNLIGNYPNWKLISKNKKQWMYKKNLKKKYYNDNETYKFEW